MINLKNLNLHFKASMYFSLGLYSYSSFFYSYEIKFNSLSIYSMPKTIN